MHLPLGHLALERVVTGFPGDLSTCAVQVHQHFCAFGQAALHRLRLPQCLALERVMAGFPGDLSTHAINAHQLFCAFDKATLHRLRLPLERFALERVAAGSPGAGQPEQHGSVPAFDQGQRGSATLAGVHA